MRVYKKQRRDETMRLLREYKSELGCAVCGETHYACLQFHHKDPADKTYDMARISSRGLCWDKIMEEVTKCAILCANCHLKLHSEDWADWHKLRKT
jgi:hypothetical protein